MHHSGDNDSGSIPDSQGLTIDDENLFIAMCYAFLEAPGKEREEPGSLAEYPLTCQELAAWRTEFGNGSHHAMEYPSRQWILRLKEIDEINNRNRLLEAQVDYAETMINMMRETIAQLEAEKGHGQPEQLD